MKNSPSAGGEIATVLSSVALVVLVVAIVNCAIIDAGVPGSIFDDIFVFETFTELSTTELSILLTVVGDSGDAIVVDISVIS